MVRRAVGPPTGLIRSTYKFVRDLRGGINISIPPDQLADNESPDMLNLVYTQRVLAVDSGLTPFGPPIVGIPQKVIQWKDVSGTIHYVLVTTQTVYVWTGSSWKGIPTTTSGNPIITGSTSIANEDILTFSGSADWVTGQAIGYGQTGGGWRSGIAGGTSSPVTVSTNLTTGSPVVGEAIFPLYLLTSHGDRPVSWAEDPLLNWLIMTNGYDIPFYFDGTNIAPVTNLGDISLTAANYVVRFYNITAFLGTTEGAGVFPYRVRRSATGDSTNWTTLNAGFDDLGDSSDAITGAFILNPNLIILRERSIIRATYYGVGAQVYFYDYGNRTTGMRGLQLVAPNKTDSIVVSEAGIFRYQGDYNLTDIGEKVFEYLLGYLGELAPGTQNLAFAFYVPTIDETWIVYAPANQDWPNKVLRYSHKVGAFFPRQFAAPMNFAGWGTYEAGTPRTWEQLIGNWLQQTWRWSSRSTQPNFPTLLLCGADDNQVYSYDYIFSQTDNGAPIPWYFTTKDYPTPEDWETLDGLTFYGKGSIQLIEISTDFGVTYQTLAQNLMIGGTWALADVDCSITAEFLRFRFSGTDPAFKLSWFALRTMKASER